MASTFPAAIANEPPPLDVSSEDEDSEEFRSHCLKLDVPSGEPTPVSTPFKRPSNKSSASDKTKAAQLEASIDDVLVISPGDKLDASEEVYDEEVNCRAAHSSSDDSDEIKLNGVVEDSVQINETTGAQDNEGENFGFTGEQTSISGGEPLEIYLGHATNHCDSTIEPIQTGTGAHIPEPEQFGVNTSRSLEDGCTTSAEHIACDQQYANQTGSSEDRKSPLNCEDINDVDTVGLPLPFHDDDNIICDEKGDDYLEFQACNSDIQTEENSNKLEANIATITEASPDDDFEDDDFGAFQSIPHTLPPQDNASDEDDDDDDFGDFAHNPVQQTIQPITVPTKQPIAQPSQEVVEDFQDCSFKSCDVPDVARTPSAPSDFSLIKTRIDSIIKSLFVIDSNLKEPEVKTPISIDTDISVSNDSTWAQVQDFEGSQGLMFKWLSSLTEKRLLRSLNINNSNIMYHEKWGTIEVPKFARDLQSQSPLQPQSCTKSELPAKSENPAIVNNNIIISDDHDKPPSISAEAQEILRQLPDLSYMRANTLVFPQSSPSGL